MKYLTSPLLIVIFFIILFLSCTKPVLNTLKNCVDNYIIEYKKEESSPDTSQGLPIELSVKIYPSNDSLIFPEKKLPNYNNDLAIAVSGGGFRSFSSAIGQLKGLIDCGIVEKSKTISYLSGSSWFSVLFNYAPKNIPDSILLGGVVTTPPESLTLENIAILDSQFIGSPIISMTDQKIIETICTFEADKRFPTQRLFSGIFQKLLLEPFELDDANKFFTINQATANNIIDINEKLTLDDFYYMRPSRPFFIDNTTLDKKLGLTHKMYQFECTPLYFGTPQNIIHKKENGDTIFLGGGYCDIIGFNSKTPISISEDYLALIKLPSYTYTLFDMMGNCGAAPGSIFDRFGVENLMPEYNYWSVNKKSEYKSELTSFVDGGDLEDLSLIALLRRGFKNIIVFDNSADSLGSTSKGCYRGINYNIARLFGHKPKVSAFNLNNQDIQIFESSKFEDLRTGLINSKKNESEVPWYTDSYEIIEPNNFGLKKYPNNQKVRILWIYNDLNVRWKEKLTTSVKQLLSNEDKANYMANFPNYKTVFQNKEQMFQLTAEQINLLANMWYFSLREESSLGKALQDFLNRSTQL